MIERQESELDKAGNTWLAFWLFGGGAGLTTFLTLKFAASQPDWLTALVSLGVGLIFGYTFATWSWGRKIAEAIFDLIATVNWIG